METVFSPFYYEYIRFDLRDGRATIHNGRPAVSVLGTGTVSGKDYAVMLIEGKYDDRCTIQL